MRAIYRLTCLRAYDLNRDSKELQYLGRRFIQRLNRTLNEKDLLKNRIYLRNFLRKIQGEM